MRAIAVWIAITALLALGGGALAGPFGAGVAVAVSSAYLLMFIWLPRAAHRSFSSGEFARARRLFFLAGLVRITRRARRASRLSICACELGAGRWREGLAAIEALDKEPLDSAEKAVWSNNMAYALARLEERPTEALAHAVDALRQRPALAGFMHTRGIALLAAGQVDDAITAFEAMYSEDAGDGALEAERCYDLGRAWLVKGETDYACDYFSRARRAAPESAWATRAAKELESRDVEPRAMPTDGLL